MFSLNDARTLPYPLPFLFDIVRDVEAYPEFLPWLSFARVYGHTQGPHHDLSNGDGAFKADLSIDYKIGASTYTSLVTYASQQWIKAVQTQGPFEFLETLWSFQSLNCDKSQLGAVLASTPSELSAAQHKTHVSFSLQLSLKSSFLSRALGHIFQSASKEIIHAFSARAATLWQARPHDCDATYTQAF